MIGLVLAGGQSKRFGTDKALYTFADQPVNNAALAVNRLRLICETVLVSASDRNVDALTSQFADAPNVTVVTDQPPFAQHGPLSALYAATTVYPDDHDYLLLAVDYPRLSEEVLTTLAGVDNCYAVTPDTDHYTIAHLWLSKQAVAAYLNMGSFRLSRFIRDYCQCQQVHFPSSNGFINCNTIKEEIHHDTQITNERP